MTEAVEAAGEYGRRKKGGGGVVIRVSRQTESGVCTAQ